MADTPAFNTHTLYNHHARELRKANEAIAQTSKYLDQDSPHYLPAYIEKLEALKASDPPPEDIDTKIGAAKSNLLAFTKRAEQARQVIAEYPAVIQGLESANNVFLSPPEKQDEYLYVMDEETCQASCVDWDSVSQNAGQTIVEQPVDSYVFKDKQDIELAGEHQTDAVRVWSHNVCVENLKIVDNRSYTEAHRDAIQLIPPPLHRFEDDGTYVRLADQMAGAILDNVVIRGCEISAPNGPLQGIFASDGMYRNLTIENNDIGTLGTHSISIAGLLSGGSVSGNTLREVAGGQMPKISLYPARIGGNMADDGVVSILSFSTSNDQAMRYEPVFTEGEPNRLIREDGTEQVLEIEDVRNILPDSYLKLAVALQDFDYETYLGEYSSLTLGEYRQHDPFGAEQMQAWLTLRTHEFSEGREQGHPLGQPSDEQKQIGARFLAPALQAMQDGSAEDTRLVDLEHTAIRSFAMKRLAIMHGEVEPLIDVALLNERRAKMLSFLLPEDQLNNVVRIAQVAGKAVCTGSGQAVPYLKYTLFFAPDKVYHGSTDDAGVIDMSELPLGPYILSLDNEAFSLVTKDCPVLNPAEAGREESGVAARALLTDFQNKLPVVRAWIEQDADHEAKAIAALHRYLSAMNVTRDTEMTFELRRNCLAVLGLGSSWREPYNRTMVLHVSCPQTNEKTGGCLFFIIGFLKRLLGGQPR